MKIETALDAHKRIKEIDIELKNVRRLQYVIQPYKDNCVRKFFRRLIGIQSEEEELYYDCLNRYYCAPNNERNSLMYHLSNYKI